jgi:hypothetical protein
VFCLEAIFIILMGPMRDAGTTIAPSAGFAKRMPIYPRLGNET